MDVLIGMRTRAVFAAIAVSAHLAAQTPQRPAFESASIKSSPSDGPGSSVSMPPGGRFATTGLPLHGLLRFAYDVQDFQIVGAPSWVDSVLFDVQAKAGAAQIRGGEVPIEAVQLMVQQLLADRFKLTTHREVRKLPVYALVMAKGRDHLGPQPRVGADQFRIGLGR